MLVLFLICILCWISITDIYTKTIPDSAILAAIGFRFFYFLFEEGLQWRGFIVMVLDGLVISLPLLFLVFIAENIFHKYLFGGGDIKLVFVTGIYLGWERNLWTLFIACLVGCVLGLVQTRKCEDDKRYFPFGPSIALAAIISMNFF